MDKYFIKKKSLIGLWKGPFSSEELKEKLKEGAIDNSWTASIDTLKTLSLSEAISGEEKKAAKEKRDNEDKKDLKCPLCGNNDFDQDDIVLAKYGVFRVSDYKAKMLTCTQCKHILLFEAGNTFFLGVD